MGIFRRLDELSFSMPVEVGRVPEGPVVTAVATRPLRTRRHGDLLAVRFDGGELDGTVAIALSPQALRWSSSPGPAEPFRVMLYRADAGRSARAELRRVLAPQRRDALFKADLVVGAG